MNANVESAAPRLRRPTWIEDAERMDLAIYAAIAGTPTPALDVAMSRLSRAADYSRLSMTAAALLALVGKRNGRRAAAQGLASLAAHRERGQRRRQAARTPATPAPPVSSPARAPRTDAELALVPLRPLRRRLRLRDRRRPRVAGGAAPLRALAALVAYSRVHTGVHYPADVLAGALIGTALAQLTTHLARNHWPP